MKASPQNSFFILALFLFMAFMPSCIQAQNIQTPTNIELISPALPNQTLPSSIFPPKVLTPTQTPNPSTDTLEARFITAEARKEATRTAAYATLESRDAICERGFRYIFPAAEYQLTELNRFPTNSGESWTVLPCIPEKSSASKGYTKIFNSDGSKTWKISYESLPLPGDYEFIRGYEIDATGNFLYLVPRNIFGRDGWCPSCLFGYGSPLYRLELFSGKLTTILPYIDDGYYVDISISPDMHYLVYSDSRDGNNVHLKDLINGSDTKIKLEDIYVINGGFTWTLDGKRLIFAAGANGWEDGTAGISLFRLNLSTMKLQTLLLNDGRNLVPWFNSNSSKTWLGDNILNLASIKVDERNFSSNEWSINVMTGKVTRLSAPTSTSTP